MKVDVQVSLRCDRKVEQGVFGQQGQHVVEEPDPRLDRPLAAAVQIQRQLDIGLGRLAIDGGFPRLAHLKGSS